MLLAGFNILSLCLISVNLISNLSQNYLKVFLLGFILYRTLHFLDLIISFPALGKFSTTISSNFFSVTFIFSSPSRTPITQLRCMQYCLRGLQGYPQFFSFFSLYSALNYSLTSGNSHQLILPGVRNSLEVKSLVVSASTTKAQGPVCSQGSEIPQVICYGIKGY